MRTLGRFIRIGLLIFIVSLLTIGLLATCSGPATAANFSEPFVIAPPPYTMPVKEKWEDFKPSPPLEHPDRYYSLCKVIARDRFGSLPVIVWFGNCNTRGANWHRDFLFPYFFVSTISDFGDSRRRSGMLISAPGRSCAEIREPRVSTASRWGGR